MVQKRVCKDSTGHVNRKMWKNQGDGLLFFVPGQLLLKSAGLLSNEASELGIRRAEGFGDRLGTDSGSLQRRGGAQRIGG